MPVHSVQHLLLDSAFHRCTHASMKSNQPSISGPHTSQRGFLPLLLLTMAPPFSQAKQVRISNYFKHVLPTISHIHRSPNLHFHSNSHFNTHTPGLLHDMLLLDSLTYPSTFVSKCILLSITVFLSCSLPDFWAHHDCSLRYWEAVRAQILEPVFPHSNLILPHNNSTSLGTCLHVLSNQIVQNIPHRIDLRVKWINMEKPDTSKW
jgi:hypothetical protein